jgi:hypothetical protein
VFFVFFYVYFSEFIIFNNQDLSIKYVNQNLSTRIRQSKMDRLTKLRESQQKFYEKTVNDNENNGRVHCSQCWCPCCWNMVNVTKMVPTFSVCEDCHKIRY